MNQAATTTIDTALILNGAWDLACGSCILFFSNTPIFSIFSTTHMSIYRDSRNSMNPVIRRLFSYWLLTYGTVRLAAALNHENRALRTVAAATYFIEGLSYLYEDLVFNTVQPCEALFVSLASITLGLSIIAQ